MFWGCSLLSIPYVLHFTGTFQSPVTFYIEVTAKWLENLEINICYHIGVDPLGRFRLYMYETEEAPHLDKEKVDM